MNIDKYNVYLLNLVNTDVNKDAVFLGYCQLLEIANNPVINISACRPCKPVNYKLQAIVQRSIRDVRVCNERLDRISNDFHGNIPTDKRTLECLSMTDFHLVTLQHTMHLVFIYSNMSHHIILNDLLLTVLQIKEKGKQQMV